MMNINEIMKFLPHRYPFLLVDRITDLKPGVSATGLKNVTMNEPFFQGHFPGQPIMPGVLIIEAMAQVAGVMAFRSGMEGKSVYFMSIDNVKFRRPIVPGDQVIMDIKVLKQRGNVWKFSGSATVEGKVVSEAEFTAMVTDKEI
ncbi:(3R)-hydroxymyristol acyl carrier protein dehydratase [Candidatus Sulfobium mesophilum]|uniref:3-hydroxyacyl-[acyl-carrier-protein] dehydratase FabZ n=1 Tax=Candidatus Sulfobium mesophilum TaxID=2016548 RepID=A0A2U3QIK0_9BACT|nr:(3R)-hydroxymyristol acyl carrier protein dehydratase [Candidatus Sulfobium mesophilum]